MSQKLRERARIEQKRKLRKVKGKRSELIVRVARIRSFICFEVERFVDSKTMCWKLGVHGDLGGEWFI